MENNHQGNYQDSQKRLNIEPIGKKYFLLSFLYAVLVSIALNFMFAILRNPVNPNFPWLNVSRLSDYLLFTVFFWAVLPSIVFSVSLHFRTRELYVAYVLFCIIFYVFIISQASGLGGAFAIALLPYALFLHFFIPFSLAMILRVLFKKVPLATVIALAVLLLLSIGFTVYRAYSYKSYLTEDKCSLLNSGAKIDCYYNLATRTNNIEYCFDITSSINAANCLEKVMPKSNQTYTTCNKLSGYNHDLCLWLFAKKDNNPDTCSLITNEFDLNHCILDIAKKNNNPALCDKSTNRNTCRFEVMYSKP